MWYDNIFGCISTCLGPENSTQKRLAKWKNRQELQNIFTRLVSKALARYDILDYPETVNGRVLRMSLLYHGSVGFFEKSGHVLALPALPNADITLYGDFKSMYVYGRNGYNEQVPIYVPGGAESETVNRGLSSVYTVNNTPRGVWVRENPQVYPFILHCIEYAEKIADAYRVLDICRHHLKSPYIIVADEQVVPTVKKTMDRIEDNVNYIVSSGVFPVDRINILETATQPEALKSVTDLIEWYWQDFDRLCGNKANSNPDKAERLLVDEVNAGNDASQAGRNDFYDYLQEQLDFANEKMGTNMRVALLEDVRQEGEDEDELQGDDIQGLDSDAGPGAMGGRPGSGDTGD